MNFNMPALYCEDFWYLSKTGANFVLWIYLNVWIDHKFNSFGKFRQSQTSIYSLFLLRIYFVASN